MNAPHARLYLLAKALKPRTLAIRAYLLHQHEVRITLKLRADLAIIVESIKERAS